MSHRPRSAEMRGRSGVVADSETKKRIIRGLKVISEEPDPDERQRALARDRIRGALGKVLVQGELPPEKEK